MSVSQKIVNVSVSHKIVIYRVLVRGADRLVLTMVCNGPYWCLVDYMLRNGHGTWSKRTKNRFQSIWWLTDISCVTYRHLLNLFKLPIFLPKSVWTHIRFGFISVFLCTNLSIWREKIEQYIFLQSFSIFFCPQIMW